jgi:hypothetical protein
MIHELLLSVATPAMAIVAGMGTLHYCIIRSPQKNPQNS